MKTLYLNRHAKSSWTEAGLRDFDRPLNKRGRINADFLAEKFAKGHQIDLLISSPALRALTTAKTFAQALGIAENEILQRQSIYGASTSEMMEVINNIDDGHNSVMLFGHNPTFEILASYLDKAFDDHMVTCARVELHFALDSWAQVGQDTGRVTEHVYPRMYPEMEGL